MAISQKKTKGEGACKKRHLDPPEGGDLQYLAMADKSESLGDFRIVRLFSPFKHFFFGDIDIPKDATGNFRRCTQDF